MGSSALRCKKTFPLSKYFDIQALKPCNFPQREIWMQPSTQEKYERQLVGLTRAPLRFKAGTSASTGLVNVRLTRKRLACGGADHMRVNAAFRCRLDPHRGTHKKSAGRVQTWHPWRVTRRNLAWSWTGLSEGGEKGTAVLGRRRSRSGRERRRGACPPPWSS